MSKFALKVACLGLVWVACRAQLPQGSPSAATLSIRSEYRNSLSAWLAGLSVNTQSWFVTDLGVIKLAENQRGDVLVAEPFTGQWWLVR